jgi:hypothetical protein
MKCFPLEKHVFHERSAAIRHCLTATIAHPLERISKSPNPGRERMVNHNSKRLVQWGFYTKFPDDFLKSIKTRCSSFPYKINDPLSRLSQSRTCPISAFWVRYGFPLTFHLIRALFSRHSMSSNSWRFTWVKEWEKRNKHDDCSGPRKVEILISVAMIHHSPRGDVARNCWFFSNRQSIACFVTLLFDGQADVHADPPIQVKSINRSISQSVSQ